MKTSNILFLLLSTITFMSLVCCGSDDNGPRPEDPDMDNVDPDHPNGDNPNDEDPDPNDPKPTGASKTFTLGSVSDPSISGTVIFTEIDNGSTDIVIELQNTNAGETHPAHVHLNTAVEGGAIAISLNEVDGGTGMSSTNITQLDDGTSISYETLLYYDGYINVHLNSSNLETLIAQGDIGQNELTGNEKEFDLGKVSVPNIFGTATFAERANGEALVTIKAFNTFPGEVHPSHVHYNTAVEGGEIAFSFNPVNGDTGISTTNLAQLDDGTSFGYVDILNFDGYINIHISEDDLSTLLAQGDIGQNDLTGTSKIYILEGNPENSDGDIGTVTFEERVNGETLASIELNNPDDFIFERADANIYLNSIPSRGEAIISLNSLFFDVLNAKSSEFGNSKTNISQLNNGTPIDYTTLIDFDGNLALNRVGLQLPAGLVAQCDIGQNELNGNSKTYDFENRDDPNARGAITFAERLNGKILAEIEFENTSDSVFENEIRLNSVLEGGAVAITLNPAIGVLEVLRTDIAELDNGSPLSYADILNFDGHAVVRNESTDELIFSADIGQNELTGVSKEYVLESVDIPAISGKAIFAERVSGETMLSIELDNFTEAAFYEGAIYNGSVFESSNEVALILNPFDGSLGSSKTHIAELDDGTQINYEELLDFDGHISFTTEINPSLFLIVVRGDIGSNEN